MRSSTNLLKILLLIFVAFALGEIIFTIQRFGFPKLDLFKPKSGSCKMLEQKYCDQARKIITDVNGTKTEYIVFMLSPKVPLFTPIDGLLVKVKESGNSSGFVGQIRGSSGTEGAAFTGDLKFDNMIQQNVKNGDIIGTVNNTGAKIGKDSNFNLGFTMTKSTLTGPVVDENKLKQLFPKAFEKL